VEEYRQTSNILPLAFGLVPEASVDDVAANLVADIEERGTHLSTGVVGARHLLPDGHAGRTATRARRDPILPLTPHLPPSYVAVGGNETIQFVRAPDRSDPAR
jgi:hypothetical protein